MVDAWQRALVLAPHTDDGELGCGGHDGQPRRGQYRGPLRRLLHRDEVASTRLSARYAGPRGARGDGGAREISPSRSLTVNASTSARFPSGARTSSSCSWRLWEGVGHPTSSSSPTHHDVHQDVARRSRRRGCGRASGRRSSATRSRGKTFQVLLRRLRGARAASTWSARFTALEERYASQQHRRYANPEYIWNLAKVHGTNVNRELRRGVPGLPDCGVMAIDRAAHLGTQYARRGGSERRVSHTDRISNTSKRVFSMPDN